MMGKWVSLSCIIGDLYKIQNEKHLLNAVKNTAKYKFKSL